MAESSRSSDPAAKDSRPKRFVIVYLIHDALRRDLSRLCVLAHRPDLDSATAQELHAHWKYVSEQLDHHHRTEDENLWPLVRPKLAGRAEDLDVIDKMEAQHRMLEPACEAVEREFAVRRAPTGADDLAVQLEALRALVQAHLDDEETHAFPLIDKTVNDKEFEGFEKATAKALGIRGAARFFPWILEDADPDEASAALGVLPPPLRALCRHRWIPRYERHVAPLRLD